MFLMSEVPLWRSDAATPLGPKAARGQPLHAPAAVNPKPLHAPAVGRPHCAPGQQLFRERGGACSLPEVGGEIECPCRERLRAAL